MGNFLITLSKIKSKKYSIIDLTKNKPINFSIKSSSGLSTFIKLELYIEISSLKIF